MQLRIALRIAIAAKTYTGSLMPRIVLSAWAGSSAARMLFIALSYLD